MKGLPFLKFLFPFAAGVFTSIYIEIHWYYALIGCLFFFSFAWGLSYWSNQKLRASPTLMISAAIFIASFFLGSLRVDSYKDVNRKTHFTSFTGNLYEVKVDDLIEQKSKYYRFKGQVKSVADSGQIFESTGNILFYWDTSLTIKPKLGKSYWVNTSLLEIESPSNPNEFNYKEYLSYYNIYFKSYLRSIENVVVSERRVSLLNQVIHQLRDWSYNTLKKNIQNNASFLMAQALLLGGKNNLDEQTKSYFAKTGTLHVLAVSGLHVGIVFLLLSRLAQLFHGLRHFKLIKVVLVLSGVWLYALITGFSPSVQRASIMFSVFAIGGIISGKTNGLNSLFASAFIMLAYNPFLIVNVGFQLSYAAVLGILLIYPPLYQMLQFAWIKSNNIHWFIDKCWSITCVSISAQMATFPISLFYFGQFPSYFIFSNLVIIPLVFLLVCLAILLLLSSPLPWFALLIGRLFDAIASFIVWSVQWVSELPFSYASGLHLEFEQVLLIYILIIMLTLWLHQKKLKWIKYFLVGLSIFLVMINVQWIRNSKQNKLVLHSVRGSDVLTLLKGRTAYIIADSQFLINTSAQKFYLAPYFRKNYIKNTHFIRFTSKLAGFQLEKDRLDLWTYHTFYPDSRSLKRAGSEVVLTLVRNQFTDTFYRNQHQLIWKSSSPSMKDNPSTNPSLDSFAVQFIPK